MSDTNDRTRRDEARERRTKKLDWDEFERLDDRIYDRTRAGNDARETAERLRSGPRDTRTGLERAKDHLDRLEHVKDRSSMKHSADFDARREAALDDFEWRTNPEGAARRRANEGMDPATEREVREAMRRRPNRKDH